MTFAVSRCSFGGLGVADRGRSDCVDPIDSSDGDGEQERSLSRVKRERSAVGLGVIDRSRFNSAETTEK